MGRCFGWQPRAKVSMMIMRPPQHGHGRGSTRGSSARCFGRLGLLWARRHGEQLASVRNVCGSVAAGEQPIVSDAMEALRQHVDQEAPDELVGRQRHGLVAGGPLDPIVLVLEGDAVLVGGQQPAIGDRDAVGVARQIAQHLLGPGERLLGVDHPIDLAQWRQIGMECSLVGEPHMIAEELQRPASCAATSISRNSRRNNAERTSTGQKIARSARDPLRSIRRQAATRHDHVHMRVVGERGAPGVQHRHEADASAEMLGIGRDRERGLGRGFEQQVVDHRLVLIGDVGGSLPAVCTPHESTAPAAARPRARPATRVPQRPDTWGSAGCGSYCRR